MEEKEQISSVIRRVSTQGSAGVDGWATRVDGRATGGDGKGAKENFIVKVFVCLYISCVL
jgi:hypothetical protein